MGLQIVDVYVSAPTGWWNVFEDVEALKRARASLLLGSTTETPQLDLRDEDGLISWKNEVNSEMEWLLKMVFVIA